MCGSVYSAQYTSKQGTFLLLLFSGAVNTRISDVFSELVEKLSVLQLNFQRNVLPFNQAHRNSSQCSAQDEHANPEM